MNSGMSLFIHLPEHLHLSPPPENYEFDNLSPLSQFYPLSAVCLWGTQLDVITINELLMIEFGRNINIGSIITHSVNLTLWFQHNY